MDKLLSNVEIQNQIGKLPKWKVEGKELRCERKFKNFIEAIQFVNKLVEPAEQAGHHPDLEISYNKVTIILTTHDVGGLTEADFQLASQISNIS